MNNFSRFLFFFDDFDMNMRFSSTFSSFLQIAVSLCAEKDYTCQKLLHCSFHDILMIRRIHGNEKFD
jgi:hypothetical protein